MAYRKGIGFRLGAVLFGFVAGLLFLEAGLRFFRSASPPLEKTYQLVPNKTFRLTSSKKGEYDVSARTNNLGLRGADVRPEKEPGTPRVILVGDSFTFGVGAEENETIPYLLEKALREGGTEAEVLNAGIGHTSPLSDYLRIRERYLALKPDLVVLLLDFTDLQDDWRDEPHLILKRDGSPAYLDDTMVHGKRDWWRFARKQSALCKYLHDKVIRTVDKIRILGIRRYLAAKLSGKKAKAVLVNTQMLGAGREAIAYDHFFFIRGRERLPEIRLHWERTAKYLLMIQDLLRQNRIPFLLVIYPHGIHVGPEEWGEGRVQWGFERGKLYSDPYAFELVEDFARRHSIALVNVRKDFLEAEAAGRGPLFFSWDGHLTPEGNRVLAEALMRSVHLRRMLGAGNVQ